MIRGSWRVLWLLPFALQSAAQAAGTSGGNVLSMGVGARAIAMGEAYTAQSDDASSLYWNPAGLGLLNQSQASFMYNPAYQGMAFNNASVATPLENGGVGASLSYLSFGKIQGYDVNDNPTSDVSAYSAVGTVGAAFFSGQSWAAGMNLKGVQASLADVKATGFASDFGLTYIHPTEVLTGTLRAGATVRNLGTGLKFIDQRDPFPSEYRFGVAGVQMLDRHLTVSADVGKSRDASLAEYFGAEYMVARHIALRGGWIHNNQLGSGLRAGIGLKIKDLSFDYAYSGYGELGLSHRYELSLRFGAIRPTLTPEERDILRRAKLALMNQRFDEATLLFNSLAELEPGYRPAQRYLRVAMGDLERRDQVRGSLGKPSYQALRHSKASADQDDPEMKELEEMLSSDDHRVASNAPETSAVSPLIHSLDPKAKMRVEKGGAQ